MKDKILNALKSKTFFALAINIVIISQKMMLNIRELFDFFDTVDIIMEIARKNKA